MRRRILSQVWFGIEHEAFEAIEDLRDLVADKEKQAIQRSAVVRVIIWYGLKVVKKMLEAGQLDRIIQDVKRELS